ncbi:hypothetical protein [Quadrisphaera sp. KR29]|uniref:hypothetical protein n=1 Tax=Quadrisphaera sp. KR29 TaxID=3461391 RepID=UPI004043C151
MSAATSHAPVLAAGVAGLLGDPFADAMREGAAWVMAATLGWWVAVPSVDVATSPAGVIRGYVVWLSLAVATGGVMWQAILLMVSRRPDPLLDIGRGLFTLVLWAAIGIAAPAAALRAGDAFSTWVLLHAADGDPSTRLMSLAQLTGVNSSGAVIVLGLLLMLAGLAQAVVMVFREGAVVVLAGVVVLAAAGSLTAATRSWLPRVLSWMLALIAYKPVAALVYATAVVLMGDDQDPRTVLVGLTMMLLAIIALPALMRFFSWTTSGIASGGGAMAVAGMTASAVSTAAALHASRSSAGAGAAAQASRLRDDLGPGAGPEPPSGAPAGAPPAPAGPPPATPAATGAAAAPASGAAAGAGSASTAAGTATTAAGATATGAVPVGAALAVVAAGQAAIDGVRQAASSAADELTVEARS